MIFSPQPGKQSAVRETVRGQMTLGDHVANESHSEFQYFAKYYTNFGKCKCIHIGHRNMDEEYKMGDAVLCRTTQGNDLGVTFSAEMKVSEQCGIAASKGNQILSIIRRTIMYKEKQLIVPLYKAIVIPHLEYYVQAWRPFRKKDID